MILVNYIHVCDGPDHHTEVGHDVAELYPIDAHDRPPAPKLLAGWEVSDEGKMLCPSCVKSVDTTYTGPTEDAIEEGQRRCTSTPTKTTTSSLN